jgi:hypothetical protein
MTDAPLHTWECPACSRRVPVHVHKCRCGLELDEADKALLHAEMRQRAEPAPGPSSLAQRLAAAVVGYRGDVTLALGWQLLCCVIFLASGAAVFAFTGSMLKSGEGAQRARDVRVLGRLDDYTKLVGPKVRNSIPGFLAMQGRLGLIDPASPTASVTDIPEGELQKGFCSASVASLIRQQYPGSYDTWKDADLEKTVLIKHPDYKNKMCILPAWIDGAPHDIVKYEGEIESSNVSHSRTLLLTTLATAAFALVFLNVYYRLIA